METLIRQNVASNLGLHCLPMSHKKEARLIWVKGPMTHYTSGGFRGGAFGASAPPAESIVKKS